MAPPLQVTDAGLVRLIWSNGGTPYAVNVYGFSGANLTPPNQTNVNSFAVDLANRFSTAALRGNLGTVITLTGINVRSIHAANLPELVGVFTPVAGSDAGSLLPLQVSYCITLRTDFAGRQNRGRSYITGFVTTTNSATGTPAAAVRTNSEAWLGQIQAALTARQWTHAVISRPVWQEVTPPTVPPTFTLVRAGHFNNVRTVTGRDLIWDTQRRRLYPGI